MIDEIIKRFNTVNEIPDTELFYTNIYTLMVACILSARATDKKVNEVTKPLFKTIATPSDMLDFGIDNLLKATDCIGLYKNKCKYIMESSSILISNYSSIVPDNIEQLLSLPGVGRKTANVILSVGYNKDTLPVDTHVGRLANRLGLSKSTNPYIIEKDLCNIIHEGYRSKMHHWLVLHGRYVCKAINPKCNNCMFNDICEYIKIGEKDD